MGQHSFPRHLPRCPTCYPGGIALDRPATPALYSILAFAFGTVIGYGVAGVFGPAYIFAPLCIGGPLGWLSLLFVVSQQSAPRRYPNLNSRTFELFIPEAGGRTLKRHSMKLSDGEWHELREIAEAHRVGVPFTYRDVKRYTYWRKRLLHWHWLDWRTYGQDGPVRKDGVYFTRGGEAWLRHLLTPPPQVGRA